MSHHVIFCPSGNATALLWGHDLGLVACFTIASPLYTLIVWTLVEHPNRTCEWNYPGRYLNGSNSDSMPESECFESFSLLQEDALHALWEQYEPPDYKPCPSLKPTRD